MNLTFKLPFTPLRFNSYRNTSWEERCVSLRVGESRMWENRRGGAMEAGWGCFRKNVGFSAIWMLLSKKLTFLSLSFLICTMEIIMIVAPSGMTED